MTDFWEAVQFKEHNGKWRATRLGYARQSKEGPGYEVYLDALPTPDNKGVTRITIQPQRDKQAAPNDPAKQGPQGGGDLDDEVPF